jgi:4-oxalocrotonate tautomerase
MQASTEAERRQPSNRSYINQFRKGSEITMPFTTIKVIEGVFSDEQKAEMIRKVTEAMVEVEGESMRDLTWVTIEEVNKGDWAIGGKFPKPKPKGS